MIFGAHVIVYSKDGDADRQFLRDVLGFSSVDAGHGWLIFALPPAEIAVHPAEENGKHELYLMCDDLQAEMAALAAKGVQCSEVHNERWGSITKIGLPGGGEWALSAEGIRWRSSGIENGLASRALVDGMTQMHLADWGGSA
jgi:catechol 2,3-dioxygenase-like lactoylglutathione lyase family enzyme